VPLIQLGWNRPARGRKLTELMLLAKRQAAFRALDRFYRLFRVTGPIIGERLFRQALCCRKAAYGLRRREFGDFWG
jgi:hypothetical protein